MAQQTAVEWLVNMLYSPVCNGFLNGQRRDIPSHIIEQAKAMEKEQIRDAWSSGALDTYIQNGEQYYNETYQQ